MTYQEYEQKIETIALNAPPGACRRFAIESISLLRRTAEPAIQKELTLGERALLSALLDDLESKSADDLAQALKELANSTSKDAVRGIELSRNLVELMCAIDHWIQYTRSSDRRAIARLAVNVVNAVDYAVGCDSGTPSINDFVAHPQMAAEFERQCRLLAASCDEI